MIMTIQLAICGRKILLGGRSDEKADPEEINATAEDAPSKRLLAIKLPLLNKLITRQLSSLVIGRWNKLII